MLAISRNQISKNLKIKNIRGLCFFFDILVNLLNRPAKFVALGSSGELTTLPVRELVTDPQ